MRLLKIGTKGAVDCDRVFALHVELSQVVVRDVEGMQVCISCGNEAKAQEVFDAALRSLERPHFERVKAAIEDCVSTAVLRIRQQYPDISKEKVRQIIEANVQKAMDSLGLETEYVPF